MPRRPAGKPPASLENQVKAMAMGAVRHFLHFHPDAVTGWWKEVPPGQERSRIELSIGKRAGNNICGLLRVEGKLP